LLFLRNLRTLRILRSFTLLGRGASPLARDARNPRALIAP